MNISGKISSAQFRDVVLASWRLGRMEQDLRAADLVKEIKRRLLAELQANAEAETPEGGRPAASGLETVQATKAVSGPEMAQAAARVVSEPEIARTAVKAVSESEMAQAAARVVNGPETAQTAVKASSKPEAAHEGSGPAALPECGESAAMQAAGTPEAARGGGIPASAPANGELAPRQAEPRSGGTGRQPAAGRRAE